LEQVCNKNEKNRKVEYKNDLVLKSMGIRLALDKMNIELLKDIKDFISLFYGTEERDIQ
jgi:hypothetical protein